MPGWVDLKGSYIATRIWRLLTVSFNNFAKLGERVNLINNIADDVLYPNVLVEVGKLFVMFR